MDSRYAVTSFLLRRICLGNWMGSGPPVFGVWWIWRELGQVTVFARLKCSVLSNMFPCVFISSMRSYQLIIFVD